VSCLVTIAQLLDFDVVACGTDDNEQVRSLRACYSRERSMRLLYA
jgi:hypothetical protein